MSHRTCTALDCDRKHSARGLCAMHWKRKYGKRTKYLITCETCGEPWQHERRDGRFCSDRCKGLNYSQTKTTRCALPIDHPVMLAIQQARAAERVARTAAVRPAVSKPPRRHPARECPGCACSFTPLAASAAHMVSCSPRCRRRIAKRRRRALEHNTLNEWTWSDFMRVARKFGYSCAYCGAKPGQLEPDHVVPLSRGGADVAANLLPACPPCNRDKSNHTLDEWTDRRRRQGKPARVTSWADVDTRYTHLTSVRPTATAA